MKLNILRIIIFNILLFKSNVVYAKDIDDNGSKKNGTLKPKEYTIVFPTCSFTEVSGELSLTRRFVYDINDTHRYKFAFPNKVGKIVFNNYIIQFDEDAKFPHLNCDFVSIYTSKVYSPVLVAMFGDSRFFYYTYNPQTNKWINSDILYDNRFAKDLESGVVIYVETIYDFRDAALDQRHMDARPYEDKDSSYIDNINYMTIRIYIENTSLVDFVNGVSPVKSQQTSGIVSETTASTKPINTQPVFDDVHVPKSLARRFRFKVDPGLQDKLVYPNKIDEIKIGDYVISFADTAFLPKQTVDIITVYTCKHNNPVLLYMQSKGKFYFYSMNNKVKKWSNYVLKYDNRYTLYRDENKVAYYKCAFDLSFSENEIAEEDSLVRSSCQGFKCPRSNIAPGQLLEVFMQESAKPKTLNMVLKPSPIENKPLPLPANNMQIVPYTKPAEPAVVPSNAPIKTSNIALNEIINNSDLKFNANIELIYTFEISPLTLRVVYRIPAAQKDNFMHPNKVEKIRFNEHIIQFDNNAVLPNVNVDYVSVYTCEHYVPRLLFVYADSRHYFYSPDEKTNKWTNHKLIYDTKYVNFKDENGIVYYRMPDDNIYSTGSKFEDKELVRKYCKRHRCSKQEDPDFSLIEIFMRVINAPTKKLPPKNQPMKKVDQQVQKKVVEKKPQPQQKPQPQPQVQKKVVEKKVVEKKPQPQQKVQLTSKVQTQTQSKKLPPPTPKIDHTPVNEYTYPLSESLREMLTTPNKVDKLIFNDYTIQFDENVKLPAPHVDTIYLYTCEHNNPVLIVMQCISYYYYYAIGGNGKWNNYKARFDTGLREFMDINGAYYYTTSLKDRDPSVQYKYENIEMVKLNCKKDKCRKVIVDKTRNLDVIMRQPVLNRYTNENLNTAPRGVKNDKNVNVQKDTKFVFGNQNTNKPTQVNKDIQITTNRNGMQVLTKSAGTQTPQVDSKSPIVVPYSHSAETSPTKRFFYDFDGLDNRLKFPNKVDRINFNGYDIEFHHEAILPNIKVANAFVYTCAHNVPFMLFLYGELRFYYYAPDPKTKKWINYELQYEERFMKRFDSNGAIYYIVNPNIKTSDKYEDRKLLKSSCKRDKCTYINVSKERDIEIYIR